MRKVFALAVALTLAFLGSSSTATAQWTFRFKPVIAEKKFFRIVVIFFRTPTKPSASLH
ncbi:MAG: hypothetical protein IPP46_14750 [Bacteroidetes bacterium]|nr:hypothetical protein [Bacteroidota bacterium]